jgi:tape measure domain-containing protein
MDGNAKALEGTMSGLGSVIASAFAVYSVSNFISKTIEAGTTVENALTGLTTLLGDSASAQAVVNNTMKDAASTPFAFEGLLAANKALIGAGVSATSARADVLNLANAIAATGGGDDELQRMVVNMQQISNTGKATAADIKQFAFAGINIYKVLADATGQPIAKVKDMEISYDMLTFALQKAHEKGGIYYNGLENMAGNTSVRISAVGDAIFQFMNNLFVETKPLIDGVINAIMGLVGIAQSIIDWTNEYTADASALGAAISVVVGGMFLYITYQKGMALWTAITTSSIIIQTFMTAALAAGFAGASASGMVLAGVMAIIQSINPVVWVIIAVAALTAGIVYLYNKFGAVRGVIMAVWEVVKTYVGIMKDYFMGLGDIIIGVFTLDLDQIKKGFNTMVDIAVNSGKKLKDAAVSGYEAGEKDFKHDKYIESALKYIDKINAEVDKGTEKSIQNAMRLTENIKKDIDNKLSSGIIGKEDKEDLLGKLRKPFKSGVAGAPGVPGVGAKDQTKGVSGPKVVTINVKIDNLIKDFSIKTVNLQESQEAIRKMVIQALTSAVNDSQIIAGT